MTLFSPSEFWADVTCHEGIAEVTWEHLKPPGSRVLHNIVEYRTNHDPHFREATRVPARMREARVPLKPGLVYEFRVRALMTNSSEIADCEHMCAAPPGPPTKNPDGVCTKDGDPHTLTIVWQVGVIFFLYH